MTDDDKSVKTRRTESGRTLEEPQIPTTLVYRVAPGTRVRLDEIDPDNTGDVQGKEEAQEELEKLVERLSELQERLFAENRQSMLVVMQALDTGGKDGAIRGVFSGVNPQGATGVRRTMQGIIPAITTNAFVPGVNGFPAGGGGGNGLTEGLINSALRFIWEQASSRVDTIVCSGAQKRKINEFLASARLFTPQDLNYINRVAAYESDFGICRIILSRWVPADTMLLLDSSRLSVMPLSGRSFQFKPLASTGDSTVGMVLGEYTLEMLNENAHGLIRGLSLT